MDFGKIGNTHPYRIEENYLRVWHVHEHVLRKRTPPCVGDTLLYAFGENDFKDSKDTSIPYNYWNNYFNLVRDNYDGK